MPTDFGTDLALELIDGQWDLPATAKTRSGPALVAQAVALRLTHAPGTWPAIPDFGSRLARAHGDSFTEAELAALEQSLRAQVLEEPRVDSATVRVDLTLSTSRLRVFVTGFTAEGPFDLVLRLDGTQLTVEKILARHGA